MMRSAKFKTLYGTRYKHCYFILPQLIQNLNKNEESYFFIVYVAICEFLGLVSRFFGRDIRIFVFPVELNIKIIGRPETIEDCASFAG